MKKLSRRVGLQDGCVSVPTTEFNGDKDKFAAMKRWGDRVKRHVAPVVQGRCESTDGARLMAKALHTGIGSEGIQLLQQTPEFSVRDKDIVKGVLDKVYALWTARLSVHFWDRLELSRATMETLRRLLSLVYDKDDDKYKPIRVWENPHDPTDYLFMASLCSRQAASRKGV
eukprot:3657832-Pleurochrysis_carterae.AAC.4